MNLRESAGIALGAVRANKLRSFLTLLGTSIGVASVIGVISVVKELNQFVSDKARADVEDKLRAKHKIDVRILDPPQTPAAKQPAVEAEMLPGSYVDYEGLVLHIP